MAINELLTQEQEGGQILPFNNTEGMFSATNDTLPQSTKAGYGNSSDTSTTNPLTETEELELLTSLYSLAEQRELPIMPYGANQLNVPGASSSPEYGNLRAPKTNNTLDYKVNNSYAKQDKKTVQSKNPASTPKTKNGKNAKSGKKDIYSILGSKGNVDDKVSNAYQMLTGKKPDTNYLSTAKKLANNTLATNTAPSADSAGNYGGLTIIVNYIIAPEEQQIYKKGAESKNYGATPKMRSAMPGESYNCNQGKKLGSASSASSKGYSPSKGYTSSKGYSGSRGKKSA